MPEFLEIVVSSLQRDRNEPWAVHMMAAPIPRSALAVYSNQVDGQRNVIMNPLRHRERELHIDGWILINFKWESIFHHALHVTHPLMHHCSGSKFIKFETSRASLALSLKWNINSNIVINLPISRCANQHPTARSREGNYRRRNPIAERKHGINNGQAGVAISREWGIICVNAVENGFLWRDRENV